MPPYIPEQLDHQQQFFHQQQMLNQQFQNLPSQFHQPPPPPYTTQSQTSQSKLPIKTEAKKTKIKRKQAEKLAKGMKPTIETQAETETLNCSFC